MICRESRKGITVPCNFLVLPLSRLYQETLVIHFMHVSCCLQVAEDVILKLRNRLEGIRDVLVLLNFTNHFGSFDSLSEIDQIGALDDGGDAILNESEVREVDA